MAEHTLLVSFPVDADQRRTLEAELPDGVVIRYLEDRPADQRADAVGDADALFSRVPQRELADEEFARLHAGQYVQSVSAGVDHLPVEAFPEGLTLLSNAGAYAEPMAEHVLAMYLALSKRLLEEHRKLQDGEFDQFESNRRVAGSTVGILGFGAIGEASARLLQRVGVSIMAINRSGASEMDVDFLGTPEDLDHVLAECDCLLVSAPLTEETRGVVDREKLELMAEDAMLINVARGELVNQRDLYEHLKENPSFRAGIEAWWTEPIRHGEFSLQYPLLDLPNVLGCPHNSAQVPGIHEEGHRRAVRNVCRALLEGEGEHAVDPQLGY